MTKLMTLDEQCSRVINGNKLAWFGKVKNRVPSDNASKEGRRGDFNISH